MGIYFGTDGIRGVAMRELDGELAFKCGNALSRLGKKIVIGTDTRVSGDALKFALISGFLSGGGNAYDLGIATTPSVAYMTRKLSADFGVVISASHNTPEFNGIKVFGGGGFKLGDEKEAEIESLFNAFEFASPTECGKYEFKGEALESYISFVTDGVRSLGSVSGGSNGDIKRPLKVGLDCANGASYRIAEAVFTRLGADVHTFHNLTDGRFINDKCGSTHIESLQKEVVENGLDCGFAFDGDADRLIAVDEKGSVVDGDLTLFALARDRLNSGTLGIKAVVGTPHTNLGVIKALENLGIVFLSSDVGDKYVLELMQKSGALLGGEQSGHIIMLDRHTTGDGVYTAVKLASLMVNGAKLSELTNVDRYSQTNVSVKVGDKVRVMGSEKLAAAIEYEKEKLGVSGRILVRASGTEPLIRIFVETKTLEHSMAVAARLKAVVESVE